MRLSMTRGEIVGTPHPPGKPRYWPTICVLTLLVASDYKLRLRANNQAVSGNADPFVLLEIGAYAAVAIFLFVRFRPQIRLKRAKPLVFLGYAYVAILAGSALYSPYLSLALVRGAQLIIVFALCRTIARHADRAALHHIAHAFAVLVAGSVVFGRVFPFPRLASQPDRFTWLYLHPVTAGEFLAIAVIVLAVYLFGNDLPRPGPRWSVQTYMILLAICAGGLIATQTRGAVFAAGIGGLAVVWTRWRGSRRVEVGALLAFALAAVALIASGRIEAFFARGESAAQLSTLNSRTELWDQAFALFPQHPLYGFGLTASRGLFLQTIGLGGGHNAFVNLIVDTGILGTVAWLALLGAIVVVTVRSVRSIGLHADRMMILAVILGMIANSIFAEGLGAPANVACTWLFVIWTWAVRAADENPVERRRNTPLHTASDVAAARPA